MNPLNRSLKQAAIALAFALAFAGPVAAAEAPHEYGRYFDHPGWRTL